MGADLAKVETLDREGRRRVEAAVRPHLDAAYNLARWLTRQDGQPYPRGVAEAVLLSLRAVQDGDRTGACAGVMEFLSVLSAAGVRRDLVDAADLVGALSGGAPLGAAVVDEALGRLAEWSLLAFTDSISPQRSPLVTLSPTLGNATNVMSVNSSAAFAVIPIAIVPSASCLCHSCVSRKR